MNFTTCTYPRSLFNMDAEENSICLNTYHKFIHCVTKQMNNTDLLEVTVFPKEIYKMTQSEARNSVLSCCTLPRDLIYINIPFFSKIILRELDYVLLIPIIRNKTNILRILVPRMDTEISSMLFLAVIETPFLNHADLLEAFEIPPILNYLEQEYSILNILNRVPLAKGLIQVKYTILCRIQNMN